MKPHTKLRQSASRIRELADELNAVVNRLRTANADDNPATPDRLDRCGDFLNSATRALIMGIVALRDADDHPR